MRFDILGPLRITDHGGGLSVTAGRDRAVLAVLLLQPGRVVAVDILIDAVWEDAPPTTARGQLQTCVSRLRRALPGAVIVTDPAGYRLDVGPDDLDATVFSRLVGEARRLSAMVPDDARRLFREALDLWRGAALAGLDAAVVRRGAAVLDEQRAAATEDWVDLELAGGRERDLLAELAGLVEQFPLRERLRAQLMLALFRSGRQADALAEFRRARVVLCDELGVEPGAALREMHQRILTGAEPAGVVRSAARQVAPVRCLPRTVGDFTGRRDVVARLVADVCAGGGTPVVHVIDGMAGSGKTTLALHVAGLVGDRYPDAHLFVDLHGHSSHQPVEPAVALTTLLRQLGVAAECIPAQFDERLALWRTELATRRALVVLDNVAGTAQIAALLPAAQGCLTLVTSRRRLVGLDDVRPESLSVLDEDEAVRLFGRIGGNRVAEDPVAAREVVRRCGRLPLAIRLAGARLAHRPRWRVADLLQRLGEPGAALPELAAEDRTVADAFALSYGQLDGAARRVFRLLGVLPTHLFDVTAVAALADLPLLDAQDVLDDLTDAHLVEEPRAGLHRLHDLMHEYARTLAAADPESERRAAVAGLLDHQIHVAGSFTGPLETDHTGLRKLLVAGPRRADLCAAVTDVHGWLEWNRAGVSPMIAAAITVSLYRSAWLLARVTWRFLFLHGYLDDILQSQRLGLDAARRAGDDAGVAHCLNYGASAYFRTGRIDEALAALRQVLRIRVELADDYGVAAAQANLGAVLHVAGQHHESLAAFSAALRFQERFNDRGVSATLTGIGLILQRVGRFDEAARIHRRCLLIAVDQQNTLLKGDVLGHLGQLRLCTGQPEVARRLLRAAIRLKTAAPYRAGEAEVRSALAVALHRTGRTLEAVAQHHEAIAVARQRGELSAESVACSDFAETMLATGDCAAALQLYRRALDIARRAQSIVAQARGHDGIAACLSADDPAVARHHWRQALAIYVRTQMPERFEVERRLNALDAGSTSVPHLVN